MKLRIIRSAGVVIAMLIPAGGMVAATAGVAGATVTGVHLTGGTPVGTGTSFKFTVNSKSNSELCNHNSGTSVWTSGTAAHNHTAFTDSTCVTTGTTTLTSGLGAATSAKLKVTGSGLVKTGKNLTLVAGKVSFLVNFGTGTGTKCTVKFSRSVKLTGATSSATKYKKTGVKMVGTATATVTPHATTTKCKKLTTLLHKTTAEFSATLHFNVTP
jgi:hypothetical protein